MGWISVTEMPQIHSTMHAFYLTSLKQYKMRFIKLNEMRVTSICLMRNWISHILYNMVVRDQRDWN